MRLAFVPVLSLLALSLACGGGADRQATDLTPTEAQPIQTVPLEGPYNVDAEEIENRPQACMPESELTDEVDPSERNIDLVMRAAELQPSDLPISPQFDNVMSNWANRRGLAEQDSYPLERLQELRSLGLLIDWFAKASLDVRNEAFTRGEVFGLTLEDDVLPKHSVEVHTFFFNSEACAKQFLEGEFDRSDREPLSFEGASGFYAPLDAVGTTEAAAALANQPVAIYVKSMYEPPSRQLSDQVRTDYPEATNFLSGEANNPSFLDVRTLVQTLAQRYQEQLSSSP